jgi:hypothetical protein
MKKFKYYLPLALTLALLVSCEQTLDELNVDPNNPSAINPRVALPSGVTSVGSVVGGRYAIIGGIWSQYYTQNNASNQYKDIDAFYYTPSDFNATWQEMYAGGLNDLEYVRKAAVSSENWGLNLMAVCIQTYGFHVLTDMFGDVPYSEALRGSEGINEPKFDDSKTEIYAGLITALDEALNHDFAAESNVNIGTADFVFDGDIDQWVKFANTLKLKIYLRYAEVEPTTAENGIEAMYTAGAEFLTSDAAINEFVDQASKSNPFYEMDKRQLNTDQNLKASRTLFDLLDQNDDPRLKIIYKEAAQAAGGYKAMNQGDFNATSTALPPLTISTGRVRPTDPVYFISAAESYFLQAEAAERGWGTGDAKALYDLGVMASFVQAASLLEDDDEEFDPIVAEDFLADGGNYSYDTFFGGGLNAILMQKWMALANTHQGLESFFDRMRTGIPQTSPVYHSDASYEPGFVVYPKESTIGNEFARRAFLPDTETARNPHAPDQADLTDPMWWHID